MRAAATTTSVPSGEMSTVYVAEGSEGLEPVMYRAPFRTSSGVKRWEIVPPSWLTGSPSEPLKEPATQLVTSSTGAVNETRTLHSSRSETVMPL